MRTVTPSLCVLVFAAVSAWGSSAVNALRVLPPEMVKNLAVMAAREGTPDPDRWHIVVFDPESESGLREYVIKGMLRTANRQLSQFADRVSKGDVFGPDAIKVDSDKAAQIAMQFAAANNANVAVLHYDLRKGSSDGPPLWTILCVDMAGNEIGRVVITATKGAIIMHPGFSIEPQQKLESIAEGAGVVAGVQGTTATETTGTVKKTTSQPTRKAGPGGKIATPLPYSAPRRNFFQRLFGGNTR